MAKEQQKLAEQFDARQQVAVYDAHIGMLVSMHKDCSPGLDWPALRDVPQPLEPNRKPANEDEARTTFENYTPGFFARLFGLVEKQRSKLEVAIGAGRELDDIAFQDAFAAYARKLTKWREQRDLATRVVAGDLEAYLEVVEEMNPFAEISELGSTINVRAEDPEFIEATLQVNSERVVPRESKSLLKSGKLSVKTLSSGKFNEIYQDYVCGAALRVARELFAILPVEAVDVSAVIEGKNPVTGRKDQCTILSVQVTRSITNGIKFENLTPSDCMKNFKHHMKFTKSGGFEIVDRAPLQAEAARRGR